MLIGIKDAAKLIGISIIAFCAVFICALFMNYQLDLTAVREEITSEQVMFLLEAQISSAKVTNAVSGGCLSMTSAVMLFFYIRHYIDTHRKELGILKALGYSNFKIAKGFWIFGFSVFFGAMPGFCSAFLLMPTFYQTQNADKILPDIPVHFHPRFFLYLVLIPVFSFAILAVCYAWRKLKKPALSLLKDHSQNSGRARRYMLAFFILFAAFCFSSMTQMSLQMKELSSEMMGALIMMMGLTLACTMLLLTITTVMRGNSKTIAMMRAFGYSRKECCRVVLGAYRPVSYIGFAIGTVYQHVLLRVMVDVVFADVEGVPVYEFDFQAMLISLAAFIILYEAVMYGCCERIRKITVKEIMLDE